MRDPVVVKIRRRLFAGYYDRPGAVKAFRVDLGAVLDRLESAERALDLLKQVAAAGRKGPRTQPARNAWVPSRDEGDEEP